MHVELDGLEPGREYFYRFRTGSYLSPAGRTRTAPDPARPTGPLTICAASCAEYEHGYFTAYRHLADERPTLVLPPRRLPLRTRPRTPIARTAATSVATSDPRPSASPIAGSGTPSPDGPGPAGRARGGPVAGGVGRPRAGRRLGRRVSGASAAGLPRAAGGGVPGVLREHARCAGPPLRRVSRHAALPAGRLG